MPTSSSSSLCPAPIPGKLYRLHCQTSKWQNLPCYEVVVSGTPNAERYNGPQYAAPALTLDYLHPWYVNIGDVIMLVKWEPARAERLLTDYTLLHGEKILVVRFSHDEPNLLHSRWWEEFLEEEGLP